MFLYGLYEPGEIQIRTTEAAGIDLVDQSTLGVAACYVETAAATSRPLLVLSDDH